MPTLSGKFKAKLELVSYFFRIFRNNFSECFQQHLGSHNSEKCSFWRRF